MDDRQKFAVGTAVADKDKDIAELKAAIKKNPQDLEIAVLKERQQANEARSVLGIKTKITDSNLLMRLNYWVIFCVGSIMQNPPALTSIEASASATLALSDEAFTLTLASIPSVTTNLKLIICVSAPQSNGISRAYSNAAEFIEPKTPATTAIALKSDYDAKYGAPSKRGAPKVFKYFYVNTATGEMLAVAHFEAEEDYPES